MRRRIAATLAIGVAAVAACAWWTMRAERPTPSSLEGLVAAEEPQAGRVDAVRARAEIDAGAFDVALWNPPRQEPAAPQLAENPEPLRLQLLGVVRDDAGFRAALYDPEDDRIHLVADGDALRRWRVLRVSADGVELADGRTTHRLRVREDPS